MMRYFMVQLDFLAPFDTFGEVVARHGAFLREGYEKGILLISGPDVARTRGVVVARGESEETVRDYFARDPFTVEGLARPSLVEFEPTMRQPSLNGW